MNQTNSTLAKRIAELERRLSNTKITANTLLEENRQLLVELASVKNLLESSMLSEATAKQYAEEINKQNQELVVQVEALTKTIIEAKTVYEEFSLFVWKSFVLEITNSVRVCNRRQTYEMLDAKFQSVIPDKYVSATPQQHLAEIRAQAGRDGFLAGFNTCFNYEGMMDLSELSNNYAQQIKNGW